MLKGSKISRYRILKLIDCFCLDLEASKTAVLLKLNRNTVNRYYGIFRRLVAAQQAKEFKPLTGVVEMDECYFGPNRLKGHIGPRRKGRATNKQPVFGIYERGGRVYTEIVPDCRKKTLQKIIRGRIDPASVLHSDLGSAMMGWSMWAMTNMSASRRALPSSKAKPTSMASKLSGVSLNAGS